MSNKYRTLTPAALNRAVAERLGWTHLSEEDVSDEISFFEGYSPGRKYKEKVPDYCGSMDAAMGLIEVAGISLIRSADGWYAIRPEDIFHGCAKMTLKFSDKLEPVLNDEPKRAAVECFMLWMDAKGEK